MLKKKSTAKASTAADVDEYLAKAPDAARATLEKLRKQIRSVAPEAVELISYGIPMFKHNGMLVAYAAFKNHCSFFPGAAALETFKNELKGYQTSKGTIRFPSDKPLPAALVKRLVKARLKENESRKLPSKKKARMVRKKSVTRARSKAKKI
jgi:uncharacterized protein YdhG (YjbR/CyaY superfamily)